MVVGVMVVVFRVVVVVEKVRLAGWVDRLLAADGADSGREPPPGVYHGDLRERVEAQHVDLDGHVGSVVWGRRKKGRKKIDLTFTATRYLSPYTPHVGPLDPVTFKEATLFTCIRVH